MSHLYGGFWLRVLAYVIDAIILNIASTVVGLVLGVGIGFSQPFSDPEDMSLAAASLGGLVGFGLSWIYSAVLESSSWQGTVGKKAIGLVVTDEDGGRIGFGRATGRFFAKILSAAILLIGFMMVGWTQRKQGLHDLIARTLVYKARDPRTVQAGADVFA